MKVVVLVQARVGSRRLPGKVLADVCGRPMIWHVMQRAQAVAGPEAAILCTRTEPENDALVALAMEHGWPCHRAGEALGRLAGAALVYGAELAVRVTGDCPLLDPALVAAAIRRRPDDGALTLTVTTPGWPDGLDVEVLSAAALALADDRAKFPAEREHVTLWHRTHGRVSFLKPARGAQRILDGLAPAHRKWSVDTAEDLALVRRVMPLLLPLGRAGYSWHATVDALNRLEPA